MQYQKSTRTERGAVLVHVAIAILGLTAFLALTVDYGILWMSRRQAQNAADAAAHAGAVSLAFEAPGNYDLARLSAKTIGEANMVFGQQLNITQGSGDSGDPAQDISFPNPCPPGAPGVPDTCVRVNVYRNSVKDPLPTFFARLIGRESQGVQATATAQVLTGNATDCMKPWAVADKWGENVQCTGWHPSGSCNGWEPNNIWTPDSTFDKYVKSGNEMILDTSIPNPPGYDYYQTPTLDDPGTTFTPFDAQGNPTSDYGLQIKLKLGSNKDRLSPGWFLALDLPGCGGHSGGADCYRWNIKNCNPTVYAIGDTLNVDTEQGKMQGPTRQGVEGGGGPDSHIPALIERDPDAEWSNCAIMQGGTCIPGIINSCAPGPCPAGENGTLVYKTQSPRIVPIPLFNIDEYFAGAPTGKSTVTITNIAGFFIEDFDSDGNVVGRLVAYPGLTKGSSSVDETAAYLRQIILVR